MSHLRVTCAACLLLACSACTQVNGISLGSASFRSNDQGDGGLPDGGDASARDGGRHHDDDDDDDDDDFPHRDGDGRFGLTDDSAGTNTLGTPSSSSDAGALLGDAGDAGLADATSPTDDVDDDVEPQDP